MSEVLVKRAIDRSKYPKTMMYVDRQGNICRADRPTPLSEEEKAKRKEVRDGKYREVREQKRKLRQTMFKAKKQAKAKPSVDNAEAYEKALADYQDFKNV